VLTDLDYRTKLDFKDLIAAPAGAKEDNFFTAAQILGNNPLTITDIRRMLIDIKGVRNAWVELPGDDEYTIPYSCSETSLDIPLKGLYKILIEPDDVYAAAFEKDACGNNVFPMDTVLSAIDERLHAHRNLCEDFADIQVMEKEPISFCIHIELAANFNPDDVLVNIYSSIQDFFSPAPVFYTLQQLLDKGRSMEEIFEGRAYDFISNQPLQQNGFIDAQELEDLERLTEIHASDLYRIIMGVPGVAGITRLQMMSFDEDGYEMPDAGQEWCLKLKKDHRPVLSPESSNVIFYRNKIPFTANAALVQQRYIKSISDYNKFPKKPAELDTSIPKGRQLDLAQYTSVQYEFPKVYMIGKNEVPGDESAARKAQALQLQGYLLFYDRLLADYFSQLSNVRQLFSLGKEPAQHTYFSADLSGIPQLPSLLRYEKKLPGTTYNGMQLASSPEVYSSLYLRDEMINRLVSEFTNNNIKRVVEETESGWLILLTDTADNTLLEGTVEFSTALEAEQAARDITFLATLPDSYSRINNRKEDKYSFELVYNESGNTEMLSALYETSSQYQERKERFQNHLLARFSEDFTDYALMMYNLSGKQDDPESSIQDKAAFLSTYPETSANRALAFDYKHPAEGFPVYGLQKRVGGLMGIHRSPSVSLNNFDLVNAVKQTGFIIKIPQQNTPLFVSESLHDDIETVFATFLSLGKDRNNYKSYGCPGEGVYGFRIVSPTDWISARFSAEYTTAEERDAVIAWMVQFFEDDGQYKVYPQTQEGYHFLLPDDYGKTLLKSKQGYATEAEALTAGYDFLEVLQDDNNWSVIPDISNFKIVVLQLAYHPLTFGTEVAALSKMQELQKYFHRHNLIYQKETTELYNWQAADGWQGIAPFKSVEQLPAAFIQFVELAAKAENYRTNGNVLQVVRAESGDEVLETVIAVLANAESNNVENNLKLISSESDNISKNAIRNNTNAENINAQNNLSGTRNESANVSETTIRNNTINPPNNQVSGTGTADINTFVTFYNNLWLTITDAVKTVSASSYNFKDLATSTILLTSISVADGPDVTSFTRSIVRYAADPQRLTVVSDDGCRYTVQLKDESGQLLAESPVAEGNAAAQSLMEKILLKAGQDALWIEKGDTIEAYSYNDSTRVWDSPQAAITANLKEGYQAITLYHYYFKIREDGGFLLLQEPHYYNSYEDVRTAFYNTVKFGKQRQYYQLTTRENCTYGFNITDGQDVIASHPLQYTTTVARDAAVDRTLRFLQEHGQAVTDVKMVGAWQYNWQWLSCCCWYPEIALEGLDEKPEKAEAEQALQHILQLAVNNANYQIIQEENGLRIYLMDGEVKFAIHPHWFDCEMDAANTITRLIAWAGFTLSGLQKADFSYEKDVRTDLYQQGSAETKIGYRLWDRDFRIARYKVQFDREEKRMTALEQLLKLYRRQLPAYTSMEKGGSVVLFKDSQYFFKIRINADGYWQSATAYADETAAAAAFRDNCWLILQLLLDKKNYNGASLNDKKGQLIATYVGPEPLDSQLFALQHGVYRTTDQTFAFHIYNKKTHTYDWESTHTYATPDDAEAALREFMQLLTFRGNYCLDNETVGCYYSINLGKVLLDIQRVTERCEGDKEEITADDAWDRLQVFLDKQEPGNDNFFPYTNYVANCRYAFRMVDSSVYRVAQHNGWYQSMEKREEARMQLLADIYCKKRLYGWFVNPATTKDAGILDCYFPHPEIFNFDDLWMSYDELPSWKAVDEAGLHYYQLTALDKVIWNTVTRYSTAALAEKAEQYFYVYLMEMARSGASYYYEPMAGCENAFTLYLKDMDGKVIAVAPDVICKEDIEKDRATRIFNAMMFPVVESGDGYQFEINNITVSDYETIWTSEQVYNTPEEAIKELEKACALLLLLDNYQRGDENACGPFGITLVNPDGILADHPLTYTSITARNAAIEEVQVAISSEGFHILEHILLRPRTKAQSYEAMQLTLDNITITGETVFADANAFLEALRNATGIYQDKSDVSFWKNDEKIASAKNFQIEEGTEILTGITDLSKKITDLLSKASDRNINTVQIPINCDDTVATLPVCSNVCLCDKSDNPYCDTTFLADLYSFWATVVLPAWPQRFRLARFRQFFEDTLQREAPAHIRLNIVWISPQQMLEFEQVWKQWLAALSREESCDYNSSLKELNDTLMALKNVYPAAYMYDDEGGDDKPLIILDEAMLG
jgi:hypothetical protein